MTDATMSIEDEVRAAMAEHAGEDAGDGGTQVATPEPSDIAADVAAAEAEAAARDEKGRFAKKAEEEAGEPAPQVEEKAAPDPYAFAPERAPDALKAKWSSLDPDVREAIIKRERDVHQGFTRFDEERNFGKQVKGVVAPYENYIKGLGADPVQAFDYLLKTDYALRTAQPEQRLQMFMQAARDYGVDLGQLSQFAADPNMQAQVHQNSLMTRIQQLESMVQSANVRSTEADQAQIESEIVQFSKREDRPYFGRLRPAMGALMDQGLASTLDEAYDQALWANPETRALHLAAERDAEDRKRQSAAEIARARNASGSVTGAPGSAVPTIPTNSSGSIEDDLRDAFRAVTGRI